MILLFERSFLKDLEKLNDPEIKEKVSEIIEKLEQLPTIGEIPNLKKLKGHKLAYRIRIGDYRLGLFVENSGVILSRILHRKEIYRRFP